MPETLQERRRRQTMVELEVLALDLFAERGYEAVTVADIAKEASVSIRTFFRYFATKDDIVLMSVRQLHDRLVRAVINRPDTEGAVSALREALLSTSIIPPSERPAVARRWRAVLDASALNARVRGEQAAVNPDLLAELARRMRVDADDPRPHVLLVSMIAVASASFAAWVAGGGKGSPATPLEARLDLLLRMSDFDAAVTTKPRPYRTRRTAGSA